MAAQKGELLCTPDCYACAASAPYPLGLWPVLVLVMSLFVIALLPGSPAAARRAPPRAVAAPAAAGRPPLRRGPTWCPATSSASPGPTCTKVRSIFVRKTRGAPIGLVLAPEAHMTAHQDSAMQCCLASQMHIKAELSTVLSFVECCRTCASGARAGFSCWAVPQEWHSSSMRSSWPQRSVNQRFTGLCIETLAYKALW